MIAIAFSGIVFIFFGLWKYSIVFFIYFIAGLIASTLLFISGLRCWVIGYRPAIYYTLSWIILLFGLFIYSLNYLSIIPSNFATINSIQIGSVFEVILLSLGLADRINQERKEKLLAQQKSVENLQKANNLKNFFQILPMSSAPL